MLQCIILQRNDDDRSWLWWWRIERILRSECHMIEWDSDCVTEMIYGLSFFLYKRGNKMNFYIQDEFEYGFGVGIPISLLLIPYLYFEIGENLNRVKAGKIPSNWVWFGWILAGKSFVFIFTEGYEFCCHA